MGFMKYFVLGVGILTLAPSIRPFYDFFQRRDNNSVQLVDVVKGNPRISYRFRDVTSNESEAFRKSIRESCSGSDVARNVSSYYELIQGEFDLNIEEMTQQEANDIVKRILDSSRLNVMGFH